MRPNLKLILIGLLFIFVGIFFPNFSAGLVILYGFKQILIVIIHKIEGKINDFLDAYGPAN